MDHPDEPFAKPTRPSPTIRPRCHADYRWTVPKVAAFLKALAESGSVAGAAREVGMSRQSAYRLRARLDGPEFQAAFEGARAKGLAAQAAARNAKTSSPWEGPGLAALDHLRASHAKTDRTRALAEHGDTAALQSDTVVRQGDTVGTEGDAWLVKATPIP